MQSSFAWDLPRNLTIKCSLFCTKFIPKNLYLAENNLYKKSLFLRETARGPEPCCIMWCEGVVYLMSPGHPTDIDLQLGKACYPCSR